MTDSRTLRIGGLGLWVGALTFSVHIVLRSVITAGPDPNAAASGAFWVPVNALGVVGGLLVLLGLPAMYARLAGPGGLQGLVGMALIALAWVFFGVFLSLYGLLVMPWLADRAPALLAESSVLPVGFVVAFVAGLVAWLIGSVLCALPFLRGRVRPRWVGFVLPGSAIWAVVGTLVIAPSGPAESFAVNLLSNLGPVLLMVAAGYLGFSTWREHRRGDRAAP